MAGPVFDAKFGLIVLSVDSEREAKEIMDNEPSVKAGVHTYTISRCGCRFWSIISRRKDTSAIHRTRSSSRDHYPRYVERRLESVDDDRGRQVGFFAPDARVELRLAGRTKSICRRLAPGLRGRKTAGF